MKFDLSFRQNKNFGTFVIGIIIVLITLFFINRFQQIDNSLIFDTFTKFRNPGSPTTDLTQKLQSFNPPKDASRDIVLVGIDAKSLQKMGRWPFPRKYYKNIFDFFLDENGKSLPKKILLDIAFTEKSGSLKENELSANAIKKNDNVILQYYFDSKKATGKTKEIIENENKIKEYSILQEKHLFTKSGKPLRYNSINDRSIIPTQEPYLSAASELGAPQVPDGDVKRGLRLLFFHNDRIYFHVILFMAFDYYGISMNDVEVYLGSHILLKNIQKNSDENEIKIPIDNKGVLTVDFIGNSLHNWRVRSLEEIYNNRASNKAYKDKYVFIGMYATGAVKDYWPTPGGDMFGVELIALGFNTIINELYFTNLNIYISTLLIIIFSIGLCYLFKNLPIIRMYILVIVFLFVYSIISYVLFLNHFLIPYSSIIFVTVISLISIIIYRIFTEEKEKKFIRSTFSNFVSKVVVDELLQNPEMLKLGGERKEISVLFSDIRSFTTLSENFKAEEIVKHLNNYLSAMTDIIFKYHGTLDKYVGDEIMAFWGAPLPQEDHAALSCCVALESMEALGVFNKNMNNDDWDIGIGINSGDVIVGNMGSASRMDYTLIGDNVNLGARLEGTNKIYGTHIIVSEYTYEKVKDLFEFRLLDKIRVKGKSKSVKIYELLDYKDNFDKEELIKKYGKKESV